MAFARFALLVISISHLSDAFVDTYVYLHPETKACKEELANYAYSFYDQRDQLLASYTGDVSESCKSKLAKEQSYGIVTVQLQTFMIQTVDQVKTIDKDWSKASEDCFKDQNCIALTNEKWRCKLAIFKSLKKSEIDQINQNNLDKVKSYMDTCIAAPE